MTTAELFYRFGEQSLGHTIDRTSSPGREAGAFFTSWDVGHDSSAFGLGNSRSLAPRFLGLRAALAFRALGANRECEQASVRELLLWARTDDSASIGRALERA